jgi:flagellar biosynthesis/type III secretory pathway protein FliH
MARVPFFMANNIVSFFHYEDNICTECGHQTDGFTLKAIQPLLQRWHNISKSKIKDSYNQGKKDGAEAERMKQIDQVGVIQKAHIEGIEKGKTETMAKVSELLNKEYRIAYEQGDKDGFDRAVKEFWDKLKANKILENETIVHKVEEIETEAYNRGKKDGFENGKRQVCHICETEFNYFTDGKRDGIEIGKIRGAEAERKRIIEMIENMKNETETGYLIGDLANQITEVIIEKLKNSEAMEK